MPIIYHRTDFSSLLKKDGASHEYWRTKTVNRALTDFGIEDSFAQASKRFREHYGFRLSESTVDRVTKDSGLQAEVYLEQKLLMVVVKPIIKCDSIHRIGGRALMRSSGKKLQKHRQRVMNALLYGEGFQVPEGE